MCNVKRVAIIGGGTSGLAAATVLDPAARAGKIEYAIFEAAPRLGGVLVTERVDGCVIDAGPDSFLTEKSWGLDFVRALGLGHELIGSNDIERKTYIVVNNRLVPIPDGLMFLVPTKILPMLTTPLFSLGTKLRMAREWFCKPDGLEREESVAQMVERHFGREMVERLADPLLSGVYGGDTDKLSAAAVLPRFVEMERRYGSLSRGMLTARRHRLAAAPASASGPRPQPPLFTSLRGGMQQLVDTILGRILPEAARLNTPVAGLAREADAWWVQPRDAQAERFEAVILSLPAPVAAALLPATEAELSTELKAIDYSSSVIVLMGYDIGAFATMPPGFGFLVPHRERRRMLACTFVHKKFPHRAPPGRGLIRAFLGGASDQAVLSLSDEEILSTVRRELREITGLAAEPRFTRVFRWDRAMAQYEVGHIGRVARIEQITSHIPGLALAGNYFRGIGVPDAIATGLMAASRTLERFGLVKAQPDAYPVPK